MSTVSDASLLAFLRRISGVSISPTGSQEICNPKPVGSDYDYLVYCNNGVALQKVAQCLNEQKFVAEGDQESYEQSDSYFTSYRKGDLNFIVTGNSQFAKKHRLATAVAKKLNLMRKEDRVMIFKAFLYSEAP